MAVYKRSGCEQYSYDFRLDGKRYSGSTETSDLEEAREVEKNIRDGLQPMTGLCQSVIRKAKRNLPSAAKSHRGYVYVLKSGYFIKIGHSTDPKERVRNITTSTPGPCKMLFCFQGGPQVERALHAEFAACHYRGEWFFLCGKLKGFVEAFERQDARPETHSLTNNPTRRIA